MNLYGFAGGDPVNFSDPFGLCPPCYPGMFGNTPLPQGDPVKGAAILGAVTLGVVGAVALPALRQGRHWASVRQVRQLLRHLARFRSPGFNSGDEKSFSGELARRELLNGRVESPNRKPLPSTPRKFKRRCSFIKTRSKLPRVELLRLSV